MNYKVLQSGSAGNCTLVSYKSTNILIDCGIPLKDIIDRLDKLGLMLKDIDYILITHEHIDHIKSINYLDSYKIYASKGTLNYKGSNILEILKFTQLKDLKVLPIPSSHDVVNGVNYIIVGDEVLVYMTDTGIVDENLYPYIKDADYYIIEANHNIDMLLNSSRPQFLIDRIRGDKGHLSNIQCAEILANSIGSHTKEVTLAHISEDCNKKELALKEVQEYLINKNVDISNIRFIAAERYVETER